jgi:hypothetical protein
MAHAEHKVSGLKLQTPKSPVLQWNEHTTLKCFVCRQFPKPAFSVSRKDGRLDSFFTASFMVRICCLKLYWTLFLENHLSLGLENQDTQGILLQGVSPEYKQK